MSLFGWRNVDIAIWTGMPLPAHLRDWSTVIQRRVRELGGPASLVSIVREVHMPDDALRKAYKDFSALHAADYLLNVFVFAQAGFTASLLRGMVMSFRALTQKPSTLLVAGSLAEVADWLPERHMQATAVQLDRAELLRALETAAARR